MGPAGGSSELHANRSLCAAGRGSAIPRTGAQMSRRDQRRAHLRAGALPAPQQVASNVNGRERDVLRRGSSIVRRGAAQWARPSTPRRPRRAPGPCAASASTREGARRAPSPITLPMRSRVGRRGRNAHLGAPACGPAPAPDRAPGFEVDCTATRSVSAQRRPPLSRRSSPLPDGRDRAAAGRAGSASTRAGWAAHAARSSSGPPWSIAAASPPPPPRRADSQQPAMQVDARRQGEAFEQQPQEGHRRPGRLLLGRCACPPAARRPPPAGAGPQPRALAPHPRRLLLPRAPSRPAPAAGAPFLSDTQRFAPPAAAAASPAALGPGSYAPPRSAFDAARKQYAWPAAAAPGFGSGCAQRPRQLVAPDLAEGPGPGAHDPLPPGAALGAAAVDKHGGRCGSFASSAARWVRLCLAWGGTAQALGAPEGLGRRQGGQEGQHCGGGGGAPRHAQPPSAAWRLPCARAGGCHSCWAPTAGGARRRARPAWAPAATRTTPPPTLQPRRLPTPACQTAPSPAAAGGRACRRRRARCRAPGRTTWPPPRRRGWRAAAAPPRR
jgi:hypothetical protein